MDLIWLHMLFYMLSILTRTSLCQPSSSNVCIDPSNLSKVTMGGTFPGHTFRSITTGGLMMCAKECLKRNRCFSFNFNLQQGLCELNDVTSIPGDIVMSLNWAHSNIGHFPFTLAKACVSHTCALNEVCIPDAKGYVCETEFPSNCSEIKQCSPDSGDGEYWIYLVNFDMVRVRVYCHNMATDRPSEFVTLSVPNYGYYPQLTNYGCTGEVQGLVAQCLTNNNGGEAWFTKIRLTPENLSVDKYDWTFATLTNADLPYGVAGDCYVEHDNDKAWCGPKGKFTINLKNTGFAVSPQVVWMTFSWKPWIEVDRSLDGTEVYLNCGGFPGGCMPDGPLILVPFSTTGESARLLTSGIRLS